MKLFYSPTSPFVRKVMVVAHELGIADKIELQRVLVSPHLPNPELAAFNPLMKLPTLLADNGEVLFGSQLICEFLDHAHGARLFPQSPSIRWRVGRLHALADGMLEAGIACREDLHRYGRMEADTWTDGRKMKIFQGLDYLESVADELASQVNIATIAVAVAISWLRFREFIDDLVPTTPKLAIWHQEFVSRSSMLQTKPAEDSLGWKSR